MDRPKNEGSYIYLPDLPFTISVTVEKTEDKGYSIEYLIDMLSSIRKAVIVLLSGSKGKPTKVSQLDRFSLCGEERLKGLILFNIYLFLLFVLVNLR